MTDFAALRRTMVDTQVRTADVTNQRLTAAMLELPRERFVPAQSAALAYLDLDVPVGEAGGRSARRLLKPMVLAKMIQLAEIEPTDHVLDVGCASGYSAALLAQLAGTVVALEEDAALAASAEAELAALGAGNTKTVRGPLAAGWAATGPYDAIVVEGVVEVEPETLLAQLKDGGRLVCILGRNAAPKVMLYRSVNGEFSGRPMFDASGPSLPGFSRPPAFIF